MGKIVEEKYKNSVIKVFTKEQGKRVRQFWENQGLDTSHFANLEIGRYYGHDNYDGFDLFRRFDQKNVIIHNLKIITLPIDKQMLVFLGKLFLKMLKK